MPRDPRTYITVHDGMPDHPKIDPLSDGAFRLLVTMWCWCSRNKTDGKIPLPTWNKRGNARTRAELMAAGLVEPAPDNAVLMHDYLEHQRSAAEIEAMIDKRRKAGSKGGHAKAAALASAMASATPFAKQKPKQTPSKPVADTDKSVNSSNAVGLRNAQTGAVPRIIRAYVDACRTANIPAPEEAQARIDRSATSLVAQGYDEADLIEAARNAAIGGWTDLAVQMQRDAARATPTAAKGSTTDLRYHGAIDLAEHLDRKAIG